MNIGNIGKRLSLDESPSEAPAVESRMELTAEWMVDSDRIANLSRLLTPEESAAQNKELEKKREERKREPKGRAEKESAREKLESRCIVVLAHRTGEIHECTIFHQTHALFSLEEICDLHPSYERQLQSIISGGPWDPAGVGVTQYSILKEYSETKVRICPRCCARCDTAFINCLTKGTLE